MDYIKVQGCFLHGNKHGKKLFYIFSKGQEEKRYSVYLCEECQQMYFGEGVPIGDRAMKKYHDTDYVIHIANGPVELPDSFTIKGYKKCKCYRNKKPFKIHSFMLPSGDVAYISADCCRTCGEYYISTYDWEAYRETLIRLGTKIYGIQIPPILMNNTKGECQEPYDPLTEAKPIDKEKNLMDEDALDKVCGTIGIQDFVVRRSAFKCMHNQHTISNIDAVLKIMKKRDGKIVDKKVAAGFCAECNTYFIMESTFENIKKYGIPLCRISDEKTYLSNSRIGDIQMAQESVLMQFGYNVGQKEDLSESIRHRILAIIIDNHILSKAEIISYLDFFISQRMSQHKYEIAISKWEKDKEFVSSYRQGEFTQYGVNAIYR